MRRHPRRKRRVRSRRPRPPRRKPKPTSIKARSTASSAECFETSAFGGLLGVRTLTPALSQREREREKRKALSQREREKKGLQNALWPPFEMPRFRAAPQGEVLFSLVVQQYP